MANPPKRTYNITALQRGLRILELFTKSEKGLPASHVAKLSGLPVSTVHRFLVNLEGAGYLNCGGTGIYHLGIACFSLGHAALGQLDIRRLSLPHLHELNAQTRETIHLTIRQALSAVYIEKLDSPEPLRIYSRIGAAVPLHCTAVGKVILAYMPEVELSGVLPHLDFKRRTQNSIGNLQELETQLQKVRRNGYAYDLEENEPHIRCVAAPIWDHTAAVHAALSVTGPAVRMSMMRLRQLAPLVQQSGIRISRELGYQGASSSEPSAMAAKAGAPSTSPGRIAV
ncbi:MAG: IclR family transcriptional regulator [Acidobacteria bacterium]|nr:IclR family transcriptional regulator [Acidobacteriota bacterium]